MKSAPEKFDKIQIHQTPFTEAECDKIIAEGKEKFDTAQKDIVRFSNFMLEIAKECGLVSKDTVIIMLANLAREGGVGSIIEEVDNKNPNVGTTITFYEGGMKLYSKYEYFSPIDLVKGYDERF